MSILAPSPTSVYLYRDADETLIYVGVTSRGIKRNREHDRTKEWWPFVATQEVEHHADRRSALARERELIETFAPPFNTTHNPLAAVARDTYLATGHREAELPADRRIDLRVTADRDDSVATLMTGPEHASLVRRTKVADDFILVVTGSGKAKLIAAQKYGAHLVIRVRVAAPDRLASARLMFKHDGPDLRIKRIELTREVAK